MWLSYLKCYIKLLKNSKFTLNINRKIIHTFYNLATCLFSRTNALTFAKREYFHLPFRRAPNVNVISVRFCVRIINHSLCREKKESPLFPLNRHRPLSARETVRLQKVRLELHLVRILFLLVEYRSLLD